MENNLTSHDLFAIKHLLDKEIARKIELLYYLRTNNDSVIYLTSSLKDDNLTLIKIINLIKN